MKSNFTRMICNTNKNVVLAGILIGIILCSNLVFAADVYLSTTGTRTVGKSNAGDWSNANCYGNLRSAMTAASGGDTITIADGTYTGSSNAITYDHLPPSGSAGNFTTIKARNIPCQNSVPCNQPLLVHFDGQSGATFLIDASLSYVIKYVKFEGIQWDGLALNRGSDHNYFKQVAVMGAFPNDSSGSATVSINSANNLFEDVVAYGQGRYKFLFYDATRTGATGDNVCRRCIARHDYSQAADTTNQQDIGSFASYLNRGTAFLNTISLDGDSPAYFQDPSYDMPGSWYQPADAGPHNMLVQGGIAINNAFGVGQVTGGSTGNTFRDVVSVKSGGGLSMLGSGTLENLLITGVNWNQFSGWRSAAQHGTGKVYAQNDGIQDWNGSSIVANNNVIANILANSYGVHASGAFGSGLNTYGVGTAQNGTITNTLTSNPIYNASTNPTGSIKYPVRVETGSTLSNAGSGGVRIGPRILYKLGKDGTFKGDTDWNTEQGELWPWPLEGWVKAQLASMPATIYGKNMPSAIRGVASPAAKQLNGTSNVTLTSYIWESLGNPMPVDIYSSVPDTTIPIVTAFTMPQTISSLVVPITTLTATDNIAIAGYVITENAIQPMVTDARWSLAPPTSYTFTSSGNKSLFAWAKDTAGNISDSRSANISVTLTDTSAPTITAFAIPSTSSGLTVSNIAITATDNVGVNGYMLNESSTSPLASDTGWTTSPQASYNFSSAGNKTLYARAKDAIGNVSASVSAGVIVTEPDATAPTISVFTMPATASSLTVAISSFTAADSIGVTGYMVTENPSSPTAGSAGWTVSTPTSFAFTTAGSKTVYAWVKDAAGNVSSGVSASVTISLSQVIGNIFYLSPTGNDTNSCSQVQPCRQLAKVLTLVQPGDTILLADGVYTGANVTLIGTAQAPITIKAQGSNAVISARSNVRGNLYLNNCSYVVVDGIKTSGGTGSLAAGIAVRFSDHVTVKNSTSNNNAMWGIFASNSPNLTLENNETYGQIAEHGIYVADASVSHDQPIIRNNRSHDNGKAGLQLNADNGGTGYFTGALIENNVFYNNVSNGLNMDGVQDSVIRNNLFYNNHGSGITMFQMNAVTGPKGNQIYNNTIDMASDSKWAIRHTNSVGVSTIRNNIFYSRNNARGAISTDTQTDVSNTDSDYNIFAGSTRAVTPDDDTTFYTLEQWQSLGKDAHSFSATATSVFTNLIGTDYHLAAGSPAIDKGQVLASVATDISSNPRPQGTGFDIGTYEAASALDVTLPTVSLFTLPATSTSFTVSIASLIASDNVAVTGYLVSENSIAPAVNASGWTVAVPTSFTFSSAGAKTAYAWAKDAAGNISASRTAAITITLPVTAPLTVSAAAGPNGSISPVGATTATSGGSLTYTIAPNPGFLVAALVVDGTLLPGATTYTFTNVTSDHYINAYFAPADLVISAAAGPNGSISPVGATPVTPNGSQTYTIAPAPGFQVAALVVDGTLLPGATTYTFTNVSASHYINAYFSPALATATITAAAAPNGTISPVGPTSAAVGTDRTYTITPAPGFSVAALVVDGTLLPGATTYTFTNVAGDHYINAYFQ